MVKLSSGHDFSRRISPDGKSVLCADTETPIHVAHRSSAVAPRLDTGTSDAGLIELERQLSIMTNSLRVSQDKVLTMNDDRLPPTEDRQRRISRIARTVNGSVMVHVTTITCVPNVSDNTCA